MKNFFFKGQKICNCVSSVDSNSNPPQQELSALGCLLFKT